MRWLLIATLATLVCGAANASEQVAESMPVTDMAASVVVRDLAAPSASLASTQPVAARELKVATKAKMAKKNKLKKSMLSRSVRNQMALLAVVPTPGGALPIEFFNDEDFESGTDSLDLHRSFSQPKVAEVAEQDDEDDNDLDISEHAKVRLLLARMKAVQAHEKKFS